MHNINDDDTAYTKSFWIGIGVSVATNIIQSFALAFQRKSHITNDLCPVEARRSSFKRPQWVASFIVFLAANITGSICSIGYLPIVILAPIGAIGLVFNAIAAKIVLNDPFSRYTVIGTVLIVIGALFVGLFGVIYEPDHDIHDLIRLYQKPAFIAYFSVMEFLIVAGILISHYMEYVYSILVSTGYPHGKIGQWVYYHSGLDQFKMYIGIGFGIISGNISSQSILFAKTGLELILLTISTDKNQLQYTLTWFILFSMVITAILQLYYLNKGLRLCNTVILVPLSACTFNVSCLFNGLMYYDQWDRLEWWRLLIVMLGISVTISGVLTISWKCHSDSQIQEAPMADEIVVEEEIRYYQSHLKTPAHEDNKRPPTEKSRLLKNRVTHYH